MRLGRLLRGLCRPLRNPLADLHLRTDLCLLGLRRLRLGLRAARRPDGPIFFRQSGPAEATAGRQLDPLVEVKLVTSAPKRNDPGAGEADRVDNCVEREDVKTSDDEDTSRRNRLVYYSRG